MQLFSRNKALAALSLGALAALGACGDDVTVPVAPAAPVVISITPPSASMNVGEALNFAVQITGGSTTAAPTLASCTSSNAAVATAAVQGSACRVTAVAAGNATVTAAASTGQVAAASVTVSAPAPAISALAISPSAAQLAVGGSLTLVPTVNRANTSVNVAFTYTSSATSVATVTAAGVVTAVAPGTATITVSAAGTGTGFSAATLTTAATITVSERAPGLTALQVSPTTVSMSSGATQVITASVQGPRAAAATYSYSSSAPTFARVSGTGASATITAVAPGTATITATAQSTQDGAFAASSITALISVTVTPNAQVVISSITKNGSTVDIANVFGQFEVNLSVQPNGQNVSSVQAWVCEQGEEVSACATRSGKPAAQQTFGGSGAQASNVQLYINSAEFDTPVWTSANPANTLFKNGLKTIVATVTTVGGTAPIASNNLSSVNFNNADGFTINWTLPTNRANDAAGNTWYGGPGATGTGSFTVVPVVYTRDRRIVSVTLNPAGSGACGRNIEDSSAPFTATYGAQMADSAGVAFNCTGVATDLNGHAPVVLASLDNNNAAGPTANGGGAAPAKSIFRLLTAAVSGGQEYYQSLQYRSSSIYVPADWQAPEVVAFDVKGGGGAGVYVDSAWVNNDYPFNQVVNTTNGLTRWRVRDNNSSQDNAISGISSARNGVGLRTARDTRFDVCLVPATIPTDAAVTCGAPGTSVASGGLTATVRSMNLAEAADLTNTAYFAIASESDRLGNRAATNPYTYTPANASTVSRTPGVNTSSPAPQAFGVDTRPPELQPITRTALSAFINTDADTIYSRNGLTVTDGASIFNDATNATFAVRVRDERSGFYSCASATTCPSTFTSGQAHIGTFAMERRRAPASPSLTNDAVIDSLISTGSALNAMNASTISADPSIRQFSINIFGSAARTPTSSGSYVAPTIGSTQAGYYQFSGQVMDRAGNTTQLPTRRVAIDNDAPVLSQIILPATFTGGQTVNVTLQGTDDLEIMGAELTIAYPNAGVPIRFRRVPFFPSQTGTNTRLGLFHNPFAAFTDGKLASTIGQGLFYGGSVPLPIPFIQDLQVVNASSQPQAAAISKPTAISAQLFDIRAMANPTGTTAPWANLASAAQTVSISGPTVSQDATAKDWATTGITSWSVFAATSTALEYRVATSTSVTNPPFSAVYIVRRAYDASTGQAADHDYLGRATFAGTVDEGGQRYYRYTFTPAAIGQGNLQSQPAIGNLDELRAIGVDARGNGLLTTATTLGTIPSVTSLSILARNIITQTGFEAWRSTFTASSTTGSSLANVGDAPFVLNSGNTATGQYRIFGAVTRPNGSGTPVYACVSNNPAVATASAVTVIASTATTAVLSCDVTLTAFAPAGLQATITMQAQGPVTTGFAGATVSAASTVVTGQGNALASITASGGAALSITKLATGTATGTFTVTPTFGSATQADHPMTYLAQVTNAAGSANASLSGTGVSASCGTDPSTGVYTCTVSATSTATAGTYYIKVRGRAVGPVFYSAPRTLSNNAEGVVAITINNPI